VGCIHRARCRAHLSGQPLSPARVACCIVSELRAAIVREWIAASKCRAVRRLYGTPARDVHASVARFERRWLSHGVLCSVGGGVLSVHLSPQHPVPVPW
jgi:hypothetical protein